MRLSKASIPAKLWLEFLRSLGEPSQFVNKRQLRAKLISGIDSALLFWPVPELKLDTRGIWHA